MQLQNLPSLSGAKSELEVPRPRLVVSAFALRAFALRLSTWIGPASLAAFAFGVTDIVRASLAVRGSVGPSSAAALLGLWLWFGQMLGVLVCLARLLAAATKHRVPNRFAWHGLWAMLAGAIALLLARKVLAGSGIQRTYLGAIGAWVIPLCVGLGTWVALWVTARVFPNGLTRVWRWAIASTAGVLAVGALVLDACAPGGYLYLHILLLTAALVVATRAVDLLRLPPIAGCTALAASIVTLPSLAAFPMDRPARELLGKPTWAGVELVAYVKFHMDFDHDGYSAVFGGGDCDDRDASVYVGAMERLGDGRDSDCDGLDGPKPSTLSFAPFRAPAIGPAQQIYAHAKQFPTVVILVDALRFDRVDDPRFPNLAQLARESIRFTRAYATSSTTLSSVPAMMTGRVRPARGRDNIARSLARVGQSSRFIAPDVLIEHFQKLGQQDPVRSFSSHEAIRTDHTMGWRPGCRVSTSEQMTAAAIAHLGSARPSDLLWLHYFDVHEWPTLDVQGAPPRGDAARYDAALQRFDASLRRLLEMRDLFTFVLIADHGEGLGARGLRSHADYLTEELAHIPLLFRVPGTEPATVDVPVASTGLFNTLRALRGLAPDGGTADDLLPLLGATRIGDGPGFAGFDAAQWSFLHGHHRLLYTPQQQLAELYDLEHDPLQGTNLAEQNPQLTSELLTRLFQIRNEPPQ
jgi:choline-sulfatase